ncbi:hypothetical protein [Streptomyces sp. NPDC056628]|uniref:Rv1733c family protein n=1 Tax=Streptomyces sp. NPDC056628 TaxID=3345882 RepID=UPI0036754527
MPARANPLRRPSDRFEWWFRRFLMALLVLGLPVATYSAGTTAYDASIHTVRAQVAQRHEVTARPTRDVPGDDQGAQQPVRVRWTEPGGVERTGATLVKPGTSKDDAVRVWVDQSGHVTDPPSSMLNARTTGWFAAAMVALGTVLATHLLWRGTRLLLDRRRYAQWDAEWDRAEPLWSARFRR